MDLSSTFSSVVQASRSLIHLKEEKIIQILHDLSRKAITHIPQILKENQKDLDRMPVTDPKYDRLKLTEERIHDISRDLINVSELPSPVGRVLDERLLKNGLELTKLSVPLGVIGIIYESRPNVTFDVFSLCLKSRNACILKGGRDAANSNKAIADLIREVLISHKVDPNIVALLPAEREATQALLGAVGFVDILIPRGSQNLIDHVRANSKVPVIETGAGIVHTYFDESGDLKKGKKIINNAKTRRVSVCNALDCLVIHRKRLKDLPELTEELKKSNVEIFADAEALKALKNHYPDQLLHEAQAEHYGTEFLSYKMSIKTVDQLDEALEHIHRYSSKHSEAIIAEDRDVIEKFLKSVDASSVYSNSSTAFTDGAQFGLGAEIGISTQKLHARGPMGLGELTSYKWIIRGDGQVRN